MASRVAASGAWLRTRSSQLSLVSNMAAHSSPVGRMPTEVNASSGTRTSTLPKRSRPMALANRRAGSTVTTNTFNPNVDAAIVATAAAVVVLPTPPEPAVTSTSRADARFRRLAPLIAATRPGSDSSERSNPSDQLLFQKIGDGVRHPCAVCADEQHRQVDQWHALREPRSKPLQMRHA